MTIVNQMVEINLRQFAIRLGYVWLWCVFGNFVLQATTIQAWDVAADHSLLQLVTLIYVWFVVRRSRKKDDAQEKKQ